MPYPIPDNEEERLKAIDEYQLLDTLPEQEYDDITQMAAEICDTPISTIALVDAHRKWHKSKYGINKDAVPREVAICAHTIMSDQPLVVPDTHEDPTFRTIGMVTNPPYVRFYAGIPLVNPEGYVLGTLCVLNTEPQQLTERQLCSLQALARFVISLFELRRALLKQQFQNQQLISYQEKIDEQNTLLESLCQTDELTGLLNRRAFNRELHREFARFQRGHTPLSLLMLDIDNFKELNDQFGHTAGDNALCKLSILLGEAIRQVDILVRYGGEEFALIMPETDLATAQLAAERIRHAVAQDTSLSNEGLTISIGVSSVNPLTLDAMTLVEMADKALYRAKQQGRNQVCVAQPATLGSPPSSQAS